MQKMTESLDQASMAEDSFLCEFTMLELPEALLSNLQSLCPCSIEMLTPILISIQALRHLAVIFFLTFHSLEVYLEAMNADQKQRLPDFRPL